MNIQDYKKSSRSEYPESCENWTVTDIVVESEENIRDSYMDENPVFSQD